MKALGSKWRRVAYGVLGQDSGLRVSILLYGPVLRGGFIWVLSHCFLSNMFFPILFVDLWSCLFISFAVDFPHVYTLCFFGESRSGLNY